jgi:hypothetical protein
MKQKFPLPYGAIAMNFQASIYRNYTSQRALPLNLSDLKMLAPDSEWKKSGV